MSQDCRPKQQWGISEVARVSQVTPLKVENDQTLL